MSGRSRLVIPIAAASAALLALGIVFSAWLRAEDRTGSGLFRWSLPGAETDEDDEDDEEENDVPLRRSKGFGTDASGAGKETSGTTRRGGDGQAVGRFPGANASGQRLFDLCSLLLAPWRRKTGGIADRTVRYDRLIVKYGRRNGVDPTLLKAVIWKESRFDRNSRGGMGELGLMQILPDGAVKDWANASGISVPSDGILMDPELNIEIGSWYLGRALERWKDYTEAETLALCEYNAGFQRANEWKPLLHDGTVIPNIDIESTRKYVEDILKQRIVYQRNWNWKELK